MHARDDAEHDALFLSVLARMVVFKLINAAVVLIMLNAPLRQAIHVGDCYEDPYCADEPVTSVSGKLLPNDEYKISGLCPSFLSDVGPPYKVDVCTDTACWRLRRNQCYPEGPFKTVEVLEP